MKITIPIKKKSGPVVVSGFPGVGKSHLARGAEFTIADSDSSKFDKEFFPDNYIEHIKDLTLNQDLDYIMVSTHEEVRDALVEEGITFLLVYPDISLKEEYRQRYVDRNSPQSFIDRIIGEWDSMVNSCVMQSGCQHVELESGQYLTDSLLQSQIPATATAILGSPGGSYPRTHAQREPSDEEEKEIEELNKEDEKKKEEEEKSKAKEGKKVKRGRGGDSDSEGEDGEDSDEGEDGEDSDDDDADPYADIKLPGDEDDGDPDGLGTDEDDENDDTDYTAGEDPGEEEDDEDLDEGDDEDSEEEEDDEDMEATASCIDREDEGSVGPKRIRRGYKAQAADSYPTVAYCYPCVGKKKACENLNGRYVVQNIKPKLMETTENLIARIHEAYLARKCDLILVSMNANVASGLKDLGVPLVAVTPAIYMRNELIVRMMKSGYPITEVDYRYLNWDDDLTSLRMTGNSVVQLEAGQYLTDVVEDLIS